MRIMYPTYTPYVALLVIALFLGALVWLDHSPAYTQAAPTYPYQLTSQHTRVNSSYPYGFTELNGAVYFGLQSKKAGLWKTDSTAQGTTLVKDVALLPASLQRIGDLLYFMANADPTHMALWKSDGTATGTIPLKTDLELSYHYESTAVGNMVYFVAADRTHGNELWQSDGTVEGTSLVADLFPGQASSYPEQLVANNGLLYFLAYNEQYERQLWQSDGTPAGTHLVTGAPERITRLKVMQNVLYWSGSDQTYGEELWRYAPGESSPTLVLDIAPGVQSAYIDKLTIMNGRLFFVADDRLHGRELWQSDGTAAGTQLVKDIAPGSNASYVENLTAVNNLLYFTADEPMAGSELWRSDGTAAGTLLVKDLVPGETGSLPNALTALNGQLYFLAWSGASGFNLWRSDGTAAGTTLIIASIFNSYSGNPFAAVNGLLYFSGYDDRHGNELWLSDGTTAGTTFVKDLDAGYTGSEFGQFVRINQRLYFTTLAYDPSGAGKIQLWMSDGTVSPAQLITEQSYTDYRALGDDLLISGYDATGPALWKHRGEAGALELVKRFAGQAPSDLIVLQDQLFFKASDDSNTPSPIYDLWRSDGTAAGTIKVVKGALNTLLPTPSVVFNGRILAVRGNEIWILNGAAGSPTHFVPAGIQGSIGRMASTPNALYFVAQQFVGMFDEIDTLWRSDGTLEGTRQLVFQPPVTYISALMPVGNALYLIAGQSELWYNDGTSQTLRRLAVLTPAHNYYNFSLMTHVNGELFFTADDGIHGPELWKSNGTPEGTVMVKDIAPAELADVPNAYPGPLFEFGDLLYFGSNDGVHGQELWRSDGTTDGTALFKDINPNTGDSSPVNFIGSAGLFFFAANDGVHGRELWQSDGTAAGTQLVADLYAGAPGADPSGSDIFSDTLYFTADNGVDGKQLFGLRTGIPLALPGEEEPALPLRSQVYFPLVKQ